MGFVKNGGLPMSLDRLFRFAARGAEICLRGDCPPVQPKAFAAWRLSVWGWVLYKFHVRLRDNKSPLFLIRLTRVLITLSKIEEKEGNHHVTVYRDYRRRAGGAYRRL